MVEAESALRTAVLFLPLLPLKGGKNTEKFPAREGAREDHIASLSLSPLHAQHEKVTEHLMDGTQEDNVVDVLGVLSVKTASCMFHSLAPLPSLIFEEVVMAISLE